MRDTRENLNYFYLNDTLLYILSGYVILVILVYLIQEKLIFKPEKLHPDFKYKYDAPFRELFFDVSPGVNINGLHFTVEKPLGLVLYFHGNTRSIKGWARYARDFFSLWL